MRFLRFKKSISEQSAGTKKGAETKMLPQEEDEGQDNDTGYGVLPLTTKEQWYREIYLRLVDKKRKPIETAAQAVNLYPTDAHMLMLAGFAAIVEEKPQLCLRYIKRYDKWYWPNEMTLTCQAIALAQAGRWPMAQNLLGKHDLLHVPPSSRYPLGLDGAWAWSWLKRIRQWAPKEPDKRKPRSKTRAKSTPRTQKQGARPKEPSLQERRKVAFSNLKPLPRIEPRATITLDMPSFDQYAALDRQIAGSVGDFLLRHDFARLSLLKGFDELVCIPHIEGVEHYLYQIETVRKVLKQFRGRVLLADEVGLGKTIEAGMILKEYLLRGMAERILILTPPSLVGQWQEEMTTKFHLNFITTHDPLFRKDPATFWSDKKIIASIATARMGRHMKLVTREPFDLVIVDEAHHLKNRTSKNWKLVDALKKRFLLMLSATPVQNNLVELYNLLTLLKPGLFKTEREFRASYMKPRQPRTPLNREHLQDLMRDVMIRNTRALVDVKLPPRQALTLRIDPSPEEARCYRELSRLIHEVHSEGVSRHRLALHRLLEAGGSSPSAVAVALERFLQGDGRASWRDLRDRYLAVGNGAKVEALLELLARNPGEKKIVFVRFRETLRLLDQTFSENGLSFARFDGQMSGQKKDEAIERFRNEAAILLCTESGGEGRNMQFCHTLINFDLPWNPQVIEQRIGRIHRIGQQHEVFVFNLATKETIEEKILTILDEKINMFELVVGEIQCILGKMDDDRDFAEMVFEAWVQETGSRNDEAFGALSDKLDKARRQYDETKAYDDELFGDEFEAV